MKKLLVGAMGVLSLSAYAQEIPSYEEINKKNADEINSEYQSKLTKHLSTLKRTFIADFSKTKFVENRRLSDSEISQKNLLSCVTKFIDKNKGGYDGPVVLQEILLTAMKDGTLTSEADSIDSANKKCREAYHYLYNFPDRTIKLEKIKKVISSLKQTSPDELKTAQFIRNQYLGSQICKISEVSAFATFGVGAGAGAVNMKCLQVSGIVRNYLGIKIGVGGGLGAKVSYSEAVDLRNVDAGKVGAFILDEGETDDTTQLVIATGAMAPSRYHYGSDRVAQSLGLGIFTGEISINVGTRFFNGSRRWGYLIDQLK
jgi:hypothetical protein